MRAPRRADLAGFLARFASEHRGVRLGRLFGAPAAYAGRRVFAVIQGDGLRCRLPPGAMPRETTERVRPAVRATGPRTERSRDWVFYGPATVREMERLLPTLELAARHAAQSLRREAR